MLTGLTIHAGQSGFPLADAPEDYNSGDLLADVLKIARPGALAQNWVLKDRATGRFLEPSLTLQQNEVGNNHDLYLVPKALATRDLELEIGAPNGKTLQCDPPSSTKCGPFLAKLVQHFGLAEVDSNGRPLRWVLVHAINQEALDPNQSLADNGVDTQDRLLILRENLPSITVEVISPQGNMDRREVPPETVTSELLAVLVKHFGLPSRTDGGAPIEWLIAHKETKERLDPAKTLAENGVGTGDQLSIERVKEPDLKLEVLSSTGDTRNHEVPGSTSAAMFLKDALASFNVQLNKPGKPNAWLLIDQKTGRRLDLEKSLAGNHVNSGDQLLVVLNSTDLRLEVTAPSGAIRAAEEPGNTRSAKLMDDLLGQFNLPRKDDKGKAIDWLLCLKDTGRILDLQETLTGNGLVDGDKLEVRQARKGLLEVVREWFLKNRNLVIAAGLVCLAIVTVAIVAKFWPHPPPPPVQVNVTPKTATVLAGGTVKFHSDVKDGGSGEAIWSIDPKVGNFTPDLVYSAPSVVQDQQSIKVTATSVKDSTKHDTAEITLSPPAINLIPSEASLGPSKTMQFTATLRADIGPAAQWSLEPNIGTVSPSGLYTAPSYIPSPQTVTLRVNSQKSPQDSVTATISLNSSPPLRVAPSTASLIASQTQQFVLLPNPGTGVQWHVNSSLGSISARGVYIAPAVVPDDAKPVVVTATVPPDAAATAPGTAIAQTATATVNLKPIIMSPANYSRLGNGEYVFRAAVTNTTNSAVQWSIEPKLGSISAQGVYTPPERIPQAQTVVVTAISLADPSKASRVSLSLAATGPEVTIRMNPYRTVLTGNESEQLVAIVTGSSNKNVTWALSGPGTITPFGIYTAPSTIRATGVPIHIIATSNADHTKSASADIVIRPAPTYSGLQSGTVTWNGRMENNQPLFITNNTPSSGNISGAFPGVPITVRLTRGALIIKPPSQGIGWKTIVIDTQKQRSISIEWQVISSGGDVKR